jgi:hypothetical protein
MSKTIAELILERNRKPFELTSVKPVLIESKSIPAKLPVAVKPILQPPQIMTKSASVPSDPPISETRLKTFAQYAIIKDQYKDDKPEPEVLQPQLNCKKDYAIQKLGYNEYIKFGGSVAKLCDRINKIDEKVCQQLPRLFNKNSFIIQSRQIHSQNPSSVICDQINSAFYGTVIDDLFKFQLVNLKPNPQVNAKRLKRINNILSRYCAKTRQVIDYLDLFPDKILEDMDTYVISKFIDKKKFFAVDVKVSSIEDNLYGEIDSIIEEELLDIKTSKYKKNTLKDFLQLFIYAGLYHKKTGKFIKRITIYNPLQGEETFIDLTDIQVGRNILDFVNQIRIACHQIQPMNRFQR